MQLKKTTSKRLLNYFRTFTILVVVLCISLTTLQCVYTDYLLKKEVEVNSRNTFTLLRHSHSLLFEQIDKALSSLFDNSQYLNLMEYYRTNQVNKLISLRDQLDTIKASMESITNICLYYPNEAFTLSTDQTFSTLDMYHDEEFLLRLYNGKILPPRSYVRDVYYALEKTPQTVISLVRTLPVFANNRSVVAYVIIDINFNSITKAFEELVIANNSSLLIYDEAGSLVSAIGTTYHVSDLLDSTPLSDDILFQQRKLDGEEYYIYSTTIANPSWTYVYVQSLSAVNMQLLQIRNTVIAICLLVLIAGLLYGWIASKRLYKPIQMISSQLGDPDIDVFDRIDQMITENEQLNNTLQENVITGRNHELLHRILLNLDMPTSDSEFPHLLPTQRECVFFLINTASDDTALAQAQLETLFLSFDMQLVIKLYTAPNEIALIVSSQTFTLASLHDAAKGLQRSMSPNKIITIGISRPFTNISRLSEAYHQAKEALGMRLVRGNSSVCCFLEIRNHTAPDYPYRLENAVLRAFRNRDMEDIIHKINEFEQYLVQKDANPQYVRDFYTQMFCSCQRLMLDQHGSDSSALSYSYRELQVLDSIADMSEYIISMLSDLLTSLQQDEVSAKSELIDRVCAYIDSHLAEAPTVDKLAAEFYLSSSGLRSEFSRVMGMSVKAYTDQKRIELAKQLLADGSLRVQDIAGKLGFNYAQSFISFFKAATTMTPGEYRAAEQAKKIEAGMTPGPQFLENHQE